MGKNIRFVASVEGGESLLRKGPLEGPVHFSNGRKATLSSSALGAAFGEILQSRAGSGLPMFVEISEESGEILDLWVPLDGRVQEILDTDEGDLKFALEFRDPILTLRRDHPNHEALAELIRTAASDEKAVLEVAADAGDVVDVRLSDRPFSPPPAMKIEEKEAFERAFVEPVTLARAKELYAAAAATSCVAATPSGSCIPFLWPDFGCQARAHEMCRITGIREKTWLRPNISQMLIAKTRNNPNCKVEWIFHVAPLVRIVENEVRREYVIDPSMFPDVVRVETWRAAQNSASAHFSLPAAIYNFYKNGEAFGDENYLSTREALQDCRDALRKRAAAKPGTPPFNCPG